MTRLGYRLAMLFCATLAAPAWGGVVAVGVLGDSLSDEYQFADDPADRKAANNYVEILAQTGRLDFGTFTTADRGEPRRQGYAFNWARSGARTKDLPAQTAGLAAQAAGGQVHYGFLLAGADDVRDIFTNGTDPAAAFAAAAANTATAAATLLATDPTFHLVIGNVPDITRTPGAAQLVALNPALAPVLAQLSAGIGLYNAQLAAQFAGQDRVAVADVNGLFNGLLADPNLVSGVTLDVATPGTDPTHLFADPIHPGTVGQALLGNLIVETLDEKFGLDVRPLSDAEIRSAAGIGGQAVPLPPGALAAIPALLLAVAAGRRFRAAGAA